jgi:hypothetical protein
MEQSRSAIVRAIGASSLFATLPPPSSLPCRAANKTSNKNRTSPLASPIQTYRHIVDHATCVVSQVARRIAVATLAFALKLSRWWPCQKVCNAKDVHIDVSNSQEGKATIESLFEYAAGL